MPRSINAQLAVNLYNDLHARYHWTADNAWQGIARLLLTCEIYRVQWEPFQNVVVYIDSNRFRPGKAGHQAQPFVDLNSYRCTWANS